MNDKSQNLLNHLQSENLTKLEIATLMVAQGMLANPAADKRVDKEKFAEDATALALLFLQSAQAVSQKLENNK
ncbi:hypothetical protein ACL6C3_20420 [Capilliphycus salinus ALCB114379]|uniref:hypothetical protein n=1 Tax=Capilliphycus salinus TaxID=2768948 RepID=UPI0039A4B2C2